MSNEYEATIIIPAYNEEIGISKILNDLKFVSENYEIIVVDDGSTDTTYENAKGFGVKIFQHRFKKGYGAAIKTGIREASAEIILTMDADAQHNVGDVARFITEMKNNNYDMVVGSRSVKSHISFLRKLGKKILNIVANYLVERKIPDLNSGFRAFKKEKALEFIHIFPNGFSFSTTITLAMLKDVYDVKYLSITTFERIGRKSSLNIIKDGLQTLLLIIRVLMLFNPLKVFIPMSILLFLCGFLFTLYGLIIIKKGVQNTGVIIILSSIMIFFFGIFADQISALRREKN